jgi:uncharacterized RDD family membrane protein YckC
MSVSSQPVAALARAGLLRRLGAVLYDALLLFALLFFAGALVLPFTGGEAVPSGNWVFSTYLLLVSFLFFGWFWTHGGQTLGMRAWRIRVQQPDGTPVTWGQALRRFLTALLSWGLFGAGFLWVLIDRNGQSWHDRASGTVSVRLPKAQ